MGPATPIGDDAAFLVEDDGESYSVSFYNNGVESSAIAWSAPGGNRDQFMWMIRSAAAFHKIKVIDESGDLPESEEVLGYSEDVQAHGYEGDG